MTFGDTILRILLQIIRSEAASAVAKHAIRAATVEVVRHIRNKTSAKTPATFH